MKKTIRKGKANNGMPSKDYWYLTDNEEKGYELSVIIKRYQLIGWDNSYDYLKTGYLIARVFKRKALVTKTFSIKVSTVKEILAWVNASER